MKTAKIPFSMLKAGTQFIYKDPYFGFNNSYMKLDDGYKNNAVFMYGELTHVPKDCIVTIKYYMPN